MNRQLKRIVITGLLLLGALPAQAYILTVDTIGDSSTGCTLEDALRAVNQSLLYVDNCPNTGAFGQEEPEHGDIIIISEKLTAAYSQSFEPDRVLKVGGALEIGNSVLIRTETSKNDQRFTISGLGSRIFYSTGVPNGVDGSEAFARSKIEFQGINFIDAQTTADNETGAALNIKGINNLVCRRCDFRNNRTQGMNGPGGAIFQENRLELENVRFGDILLGQSVANSSSGRNSPGGAVYVSNGPTVIKNVGFYHNSTSGEGSEGGALFFRAGALEIDNGTFQHNSTGIGSQATNSAGGAISTRSQSSIEIANSLFSENDTFADRSLGGAINLIGDARVSIRSTKFLDNSTFGLSSPGGAISATSGNNNMTLDVQNSRFVGNITEGTSSGAAAMYLRRVVFDFAYNEVSYNFAKGDDSLSGGISTFGTTNGVTNIIRGSTFVGNTSKGGGTGAVFRSGFESPLEIVNSTFFQNDAGNDAPSSATSISSTTTGELRIINSIVVGGRRGDQYVTACRTGITAQNSLSTDISCDGVATPEADFDLQELNFYGGDTRSIALGGNSVALGAADPSRCDSRDQRGVTRPSNCDIGAFEYAVGMDFGDLPDSYGTSLANNGAAHNVDLQAAGVVKLGNNRSIEEDAKINASATADNFDDGIYDLFFSSAQTNIGTVRVNIPQDAIAVGFQQLSAWVDWNGDGVFQTESETIFNKFNDLQKGDNALQFAVPGGVNADGIYASRWRLCYLEATCNTPTGIAADGEVEDYVTQSGQTASLPVSTPQPNNPTPTPANPSPTPAPGTATPPPTQSTPTPSSPPAATAAPTPTPNPARAADRDVAPGAKNIVLASFNISNPNTETARLTQLKLPLELSNINSEDLASVRLYRDVQGNALYDNSDELLASLKPTASATELLLTLSSAFNLPSNGEAAFIILADFK